MKKKRKPKKIMIDIGVLLYIVLAATLGASIGFSIGFSYVLFFMVAH